MISGYMKRTFFLSLALLMTACSGKVTTKTDEPVPVYAKKVDNIQHHATISVSGFIEPMSKVNLGFLVSGKISQIYVQEGDHVKANGLIARLDPTDYKYTLQIAQANRDKASDEYERLKIMYRKGSLTPSDFNKISALKDEAEAHYEIQKKQLKDTRLYTPISGIVGKRGVDPGEIIKKGLPLFNIVDTDSVKVNVAVPESEIENVRRGQSAVISVPAVDSTFSGKVIMVGVLADPASRTYTVKIVVPNPGLILRTGMIAEAKIQTDKRKDMITVPGEAIVRDPDGLTYLYVIDPTNNRAYKRRVFIGDLTGRNIEITGGLKAGEEIVTGGQFHLRDGMNVKIEKP